MRRQGKVNAQARAVGWRGVKEVLLWDIKKDCVRRLPTLSCGKVGGREVSKRNIIQEMFSKFPPCNQKKTENRKGERGWNSGGNVTHMLMSLGKCNQLTTSLYYLK